MTLIVFDLEGGSKLYTLHSTLSTIEVFLKRQELILLQDAAFPPGFDEAEAVAHQLDEGRRDGEQADPEAAILDAGVDEDDEGIE